MSDFQDLPRPNPKLLTNLNNLLIKEALDFDVLKGKVEHEHFHTFLNPEQYLIYEEVIELVDN